MATIDPHQERAETPKSDADASAFASIAEHEISQLDQPIMLGRWLELHSGDKQWVKSEDLNDILGCQTFVKREWLPSGAIVARAVYFYPPPTPSPAVLPKLSGQELRNGACTLGKVRVEAQARTTEAGRRMAQGVEDAFTKNYGSSIGLNSVPFWGRSYYQAGAARWIHNDAEIVSGYNPKPGRNISTPDEVVGGPVAFVQAMVRTVREFEREACCSMKAYRYRAIEKLEFHRAIVAAGADAALTGRLEKLYERTFHAGISPEQAHQPENLEWLDSLVPVLQNWLKALKTSTPAQRAAGLAAADLLLDAAQAVDGAPLGKPASTHPRAELQELGAVFKLGELSGWYAYENNWLKEAQELDAEGEAGQMASLVSLAHPSCDPRQVIRDGERVLTKGLDAPATAQVHFIVGDAYSDVVALATGPPLDADYDPAQFRAEAGPARAKALEQYRAGLAVDRDSENAKDAWLQAWRLSAGLVPGTRNVCMGD